jgi:hypothetical protein
MGSEIVLVFGPLSLLAIFALGYLAGVPRFRTSAILCFVLSVVASCYAVDVSPNYSFWTQAGFYGFAFIAVSLVLLPALHGLSALLNRRSSASADDA